MGVNSLPKTVTRQRRDCDLNPGPSVPESSTLTTRLPSHPYYYYYTRLMASFPMLLQRVTSQRRRAQANAPVASCPEAPKRVNSAGGKTCDASLPCILYLHFPSNI